jgi:hypothetical protein
MGMNTFTTVMSSSQTIAINKEDGVMALSVQAAPGGGTFNFLGNYTFKGIPPTALSLTNGQGVTLFAASTASPLGGITIQWVSGTVEVVISVQ